MRARHYSLSRTLKRMRRFWMNCRQLFLKGHNGRFAHHLSSMRSEKWLQITCGGDDHPVTSRQRDRSGCISTARDTRDLRLLAANNTKRYAYDSTTDSLSLIPAAGNDTGWKRERKSPVEKALVPATANV
jgi:hypothetical protein